MADDLYSGTGSTDFIFVVSYIGKWHKLGWNADINYKLNTENSLNYRYGNSSNINVRAFYEINFKNLVFYPHLGTAVESGKADVSEGVKQSNTGGEILYGSAGVDVYYKSISFASDFRLPLYHNLGEGMAVDKSWFITSINIHF
ncbi:MAG TPA: hypothetical protein PKD91_16260 [Bacteroidia bacterium]|nr:hypothetical protein [Bacteroidia bacterium]